VFVGALPTVDARYEDQPELQKILGWADDARRMQVWTNADTPEDAARARSYGAQGIGLCRTEHMFMGDRLETVRAAILIAAKATQAKQQRDSGKALDADQERLVAEFDTAMGKLETLQQGDFEGIFRAMDGLPVVVRLIDPPLHEFLPNLEEQLVKVTREGDAASDEDRELLRAIQSMQEQNPMLGLRGCRLGLLFPDFVKVQTRAILNGPRRRQARRRRSEGEDHDPAGRSRERAQGDQGSARGRGEGRRAGRGRRRGVRVRDDDRSAARRHHRGRDRRARRVLQLRHQRPHADDLRVQPRRRGGQLPAQVRRGRHPSR
jgi:hypothetical protein